jgi:uncharacterized repeat protein (TIGR03803 family)
MIELKLLREIEESRIWRSRCMNYGTQPRSWFLRIFGSVAGAATGFAIAMALLIVPRSAQAQTFTLLYTFTGGPDGRVPVGGVILDGAGNLYGTTSQGGNLACSLGCGTIFKLDTAGNETVLYSFGGTGAGDGEFPNATLVRDTQGNLYGTTEGGGAFGYGTVFKLTAAGAETVLHSFTGSGGDGKFPFGGVARDGQGNLYGTTNAGGLSGGGTVFRVGATGNETVLYNFTGMGGDGKSPYAGVVRDAQGNLYGTTESGGASNVGTVFKVDANGTETILYSFTGTGGDGAEPMTGLVHDEQGNLYGTTNSGGVGIGGGNGVVFKVDKTGREKVLFRFPGSGADGIRPHGVVRDAQGNLYGTTVFHGAFGWGTVFKLSPTGKQTVLYNFNGGNADGGDPYAGVVLDAQGNVYGATSAGAIGYGTVFKITP